MNDNTVKHEKPVAYIQAIIDSFLISTNTKKAKVGQRINFYDSEKKYCFFLVKGTCDVYRMDDSLHMMLIESPSTLGMSGLLATPDGFFVRAHESIEYLLIPWDEFIQHVEENNLWKCVAYSIASISLNLRSIHKTRTAVPTYKIICNILLDLNNEDFEIRATVSAANYIQQKTNLSRSIVMKTLAELNTGGYILIKRGLLIKVIHLPEKF